MVKVRVIFVFAFVCFSFYAKPSFAETEVSCYIVKSSPLKFRKVDMNPILGDCEIDFARISRDSVLKVRCIDNDETRYIYIDGMSCVISTR
jgi:hypothetical protein